MFWKTMLVTVLFAVAPGAGAQNRVVPPNVPGNLEVPAGYTAFLIGRAEGTQNYVCLPSGGGVSWVLFGPQATLFDENGVQVMTHFLSGNPVEGFTPRPSWQHSKDTSAVWGVAIASSTDPAFVAPGAIPWLLVRRAGVQAGPDFGDKLIRTEFIQRVNTEGGVAPATGCSLPADIGRKALVPYTTDYVFYR